MQQDHSILQFAETTLQSLEHVKLRCNIPDELLHVENTAEHNIENILQMQQSLYLKQGILLANQ